MRRSLLLPACALMALLAGPLWMMGARRSPTGSRPMPRLPLAADKTLGVNADLSRLDSTAREEALAEMESNGFHWLRQRFPWNALEPERGVYDWRVWDEIVDGASRHNLKLIAVLDGSPAWARRGEDAANALAPPAETSEFGTFAAAVASRYGRRVTAYQIWDEPNIAPHWGARWVDPAAYAGLLREGAIQVRAADPEAVVLLAALAPNVETGGANMSDVQYLDALYEGGAAQWFDAVAAQPYDFGEGLSAPPDQDRLTWARTELLRRVMEAHGDLDTAVWAVSFGWGAAEAGAAGADQARAVAAAIEVARQSWPWLGPMLWAAWSPADRLGQYGLSGPGAASAAALGALKSVATAPPVAWPGWYAADHPSGHYEGAWRVRPGGADIGRSGDRLLIRFWGTQLGLTVRRGDYRAFLFVSVEGRPGNALPRDRNGRAYVVLYDPEQGEATVTLARGLPEGVHEAEIVADGGWGQWAIVGWSASREATRQVAWLPAALFLLAIALLSMAAYAGWPHRAAVACRCRSLFERYRAVDDRLALGITAGAACLLFVVVGTAPSLMALAILALLLALRPKTGLSLVALALPFYQLGKPLMGKVFSAVEIVILLTLAAWLLNWILSSARPRLRGPGLSALDWGVLALVVAGAASLLWAEKGRVAAREFRTVILEASLFYALLRGLVRDRRQVWHITDAWIVGGLAVAGVGVGQWLSGRGLITTEGVWRVRGLYGSPNNLALYLGRLLPLGLAIAVWGKKQGRRWFYGLAAILMAAAIFLTYSRGAWLLGLPASLLFLAACRGRRAFLIVLGALLFVLVVVLLAVGPGRLSSLLNTAGGTTFFRLQLWKSSWSMIRDHPLLGVGLDNFLYQYRTRYVLPTAWEELNLSHPHNLLLDFWLRLGLPGLAILGWLLTAFFRAGRRASRQWPMGDERLLAVGLMAGMVDFVAHGLVDNAFFLVDLGCAFMLMAALIQVPADVWSPEDRGMNGR